MFPSLKRVATARRTESERQARNHGAGQGTSGGDNERDTLRRGQAAEPARRKASVVGPRSGHRALSSGDGPFVSDKRELGIACHLYN